MTILDILITKLVQNKYQLPVVVATTINSQDDIILENCNNYGLEVFRGSEDDVLSRFINCASTFGFEQIVRVCSDNPFLSLELLDQLVEKFLAHPCDYLGYMFNNGLPAIKSHIGLFTEIVAVNALKKAFHETENKLYREHVTNFLYEHPEKFDIRFIQTDKKINHSGLRITVDTKEDFLNVQKIYNGLLDKGLEINFDNIIQFVETDKQIQKSMQSQISNNVK